MNTSITEEVIVLTYNSDSFPMSLGLPLEKLRLIDPVKTDRIKECVRTELIKIVIFDGCLPMDVLLTTCKVVKDIRRKNKLNLKIFIINQDEILVEGAEYVQNPKKIKEYLKIAA
ncbi:MAG: hypothetical protein KBC11_02040 [Candidatus Pacebacteria bacterium]|nr:hypothetical protein [Candidatus Paceibacterota bacterium]